MRWDWLTYGVLAVAGLVTASLAYRGVLSRRHAPELGLVQGRLRPCGAKPNAVCSQDSSPGHAIEPWVFQGSRSEDIARLKAILLSHPRTRIVAEGDNYIHAECRSALFGFVDDVEFLVDENAHVIQVRSASRQGYSDMGVNRTRVESFRAAFRGK